MAYSRCLSVWCHHCCYYHSAQSPQQPNPVGPGPCLLPLCPAAQSRPSLQPLHRLCHPERHPDSASPQAPGPEQGLVHQLNQEAARRTESALGESHKGRHGGWEREFKSTGHSQPGSPALATYVPTHLVRLRTARFTGGVGQGDTRAASPSTECVPGGPSAQPRVWAGRAEWC